MAKFVTDSALDAMLQAARGNKIMLCAGAPIDRADAITRALTDETDPASALTGGDYSLADGDVSGRKQVLSARSNLPIDSSGTADHVAIIDDTDLIFVTPLSASLALTSGNTVDVNAIEHEVRDPS